jgi:hypothetical protein
MNAKEELIEMIRDSNKTLQDVVAYNIQLETIVDWDEEPNTNCFNIVGTNLTEEELNHIDMEYDAGYGSQELYGIVLFNDNTWLQRAEYDGSEWWVHMYPPTIQQTLEM